MEGRSALPGLGRAVGGRGINDAHSKLAVGGRDRDRDCDCDCGSASASRCARCSRTTTVPHPSQASATPRATLSASNHRHDICPDSFVPQAGERHPVAAHAGCTKSALDSASAALSRCDSSGPSAGGKASSAATKVIYAESSL